MRVKRQLITASVLVIALNLLSVVPAHAVGVNAGMGIFDSFRSSWTSGSPDLTTVTSVEFRTSGINFYLDPSSVTGDFAWDGTGTQPDYTMDPGGLVTDYAGHIGGATSSLAIGNLTFDPVGNGANFLTWYVDVPSLGTTDMLTFNLVQEQIISKTTTGSSQNLSIYLLGYVADALGHWSSSLSSINLTISRTGTNYSWSGTWADPPATAVPEPASVLLLGIGLAFVGATAYRRVGA